MLKWLPLLLPSINIDIFDKSERECEKDLNLGTDEYEKDIVCVCWFFLVFCFGVKKVIESALESPTQKETAQWEKR